MKITDRKVNSNQETATRLQKETWTTDDGRTFEVTIRAQTTGAENWRTQQTQWSVRIEDRNNQENSFSYTRTTESGAGGDMNIGPIIHEARQEWQEAQQARKGIAPETELRDLIDKTDYQYKKVPEHMTIAELWDRMKHGEHYYDICPVDSYIREIHFGAIAEAM